MLGLITFCSSEKWEPTQALVNIDMIFVSFVEARAAQAVARLATYNADGREFVHSIINKYYGSCPTTDARA